MNVGSLFSGIGGLDHGLARAGLRHVFFCEADAYRRDVLAARWPGVPVFSDVRGLCQGDHSSWPARRREGRREMGANGHGDTADRPLGWSEAVDLLAGGFPCQDVSVAGRRVGLAGERSGLFHEFARVIDALRPGWVLGENVPGLLSSNGGRDFGVVVGTLADLGYGVAWRVLDSRFFGVPQRRRRVFIVGALADGDPAAAAGRADEVLAVGSRCPGHPATRGEAREDAAVASLSGLGTGGPDDNDGQANRVIATGLVKRYGKGTDSDATDTFVVAAPLTKGSATGEGVNAPGRRQEDDVNLVPIDLRQALRANGKTGAGTPGTGIGEAGDPSYAVTGGSIPGVGVRRLTPVECERLQGLPDDWTRLDARTPDSRRYSALGDAVTATVAEWIGGRLLRASRRSLPGALPKGLQVVSRVGGGK